MAKQKVEIIPASKCIRALHEYNERLFLLLNTIPSVLDYVKQTKNENTDYKEYVIKMLEDNYKSVKEFHQ
jgi:endo-1,4-beta-mannosidase